LSTASACTHWLIGYVSYNSLPTMVWPDNVNPHVSGGLSAAGCGGPTLGAGGRPGTYAGVACVAPLYEPALLGQCVQGWVHGMGAGTGSGPSGGRRTVCAPPPAAAPRSPPAPDISFVAKGREAISSSGDLILTATTTCSRTAQPLTRGGRGGALLGYHGESDCLGLREGKTAASSCGMDMIQSDGESI
jgi:hypothetical protein